MKTQMILMALCSLLLISSARTAEPENEKNKEKETTTAEKVTSSPDNLTLPYAGSISYNGFAFGITNTASGNSIGIIGSSWGPQGQGIYGIATSNLDDARNYGGYFTSAGGKGIAVYGEAMKRDWMENYGGYFVANGKYGAGVYGSVSGGHGKGVIGKNIEYEYEGYLGTRIGGVEGRHLGSGTSGGLGNEFAGAWGKYGQNGYRASLGLADYAIRADGPVLVHGAGMRVENAGGYPLMTLDGPSGWNADFWGKIVIRSRPSNEIVLELGEGLDFAEGFDLSEHESVSPGTVLVIDPENPGELMVSGSAYDKRVAGVVSGANGNNPGVILGVDKFDCSVALVGRLYCKVDGRYGKIEPGDLLTTSPNPGHAMLADDKGRASGAILGKAMESFKMDGPGLILVLVTLQ